MYQSHHELSSAGGSSTGGSGSKRSSIQSMIRSITESPESPSSAYAFIAAEPVAIAEAASKARAKPTDRFLRIFISFPSAVRARSCVPHKKGRG